MFICLFEALKRAYYASENLCDGGEYMFDSFLIPMSWMGVEIWGGNISTSTWKESPCGIQWHPIGERLVHPLTFDISQVNIVFQITCTTVSQVTCVPLLLDPNSELCMRLGRKLIQRTWYYEWILLGIKAPRTPFLYNLTLPCESSLRELSRYNFTIFLAPIWGVISIDIIFITFVHWPCECALKVTYQ